MFPTFKKWFIPNTDNAYQPHFFRAFSVVFPVFLLLIVFGMSNTVGRMLSSNDSFFAAVVASVLVDLTNTNRAGEGLHGLAVNPTLVDAAQRKANDMAAKGYFAHTSPEGIAPWFWFAEAQYAFSYAGENLAVFFGDSHNVAQAWMNSPSHRANILNHQFTEIGIATAEGYYQGQKTVFVVQMFGTPATKPTFATLTSGGIEDGSSVDDTEGEVSGETAVAITEDNAEEVVPVSIIHEDETFIAVSGEGVKSSPSANTVSTQSSFVERLLASPQTFFSYFISALAGVVVLALVLLVFLEIRIQQPTSVLAAVAILVLMGALLYFSEESVIVAEVINVTSYFSPSAS